MLERDEIVEELVRAVEPLEGTLAMWEGGAVAFGRLDAWSDIDLCVAAEDGSADAVFAAVEDALEKISPFEKYSPSLGQEAGYRQAFYRLERASRFHIIDLAVFKISAQDLFLEPRVHGNARFFFNKGDMVKIPRADIAGLEKQVEARAQRLAMRHRFFNNFVEKEIMRGNWLEAMDYYYNITLATLVELLRMRYYPFHYQFKMRYVHQEFPADVLGRLQPLFFVQDREDLKRKYVQATEWIDETLAGARGPFRTAHKI